MIWIVLEWMGTIFALVGSVILASKTISHIPGWIAWIISNVLFIVLFIHTHQLGLVFMQIANISINILGIWQYHKGTINHNKYLSRTFYFLSLILIAITLIFFTRFIVEDNIISKFKEIEWMGSLLSVSAGLLLASYHPKAKYCWLLWFIANMLILTLTMHTKQYGFMILQIGFSLINAYGVWNWIIKSLIPIKI